MNTSILSNIEKLVKQRDFHTAGLAEIDSRLSAIRALLGGAAPTARKPGRPLKRSEDRRKSAGGKSANGNGPVTLADHLEAIVKEAGKAVAIPELVSGIGKTGYKSKSKNLRQVVSLALIKDKRFKRAGRGVYGLKEA